MIAHNICLKTDEEIKKIAEAGRIVAEVFQIIEKEIKPGVSTETLDQIATDFAYNHHAIPVFREVPGYYHSTCISINEQIVHGIPSKRKIKSGDIVKIDYGIKKDGFIGDSCKTFIVDKVVNKNKRTKSKGLKGRNPTALEKILANKIGDIGYAIQRYVEKHGFSVVRQFVGHGVGYELHEPPNVPHYGQRNTGIELKEGLVIAIEPMINVGTWKAKVLSDGWTAVTMDGKWSAQFEHTIAVTKHGPQVLTML